MKTQISDEELAEQLVESFEIARDFWRKNQGIVENFLNEFSEYFRAGFEESSRTLSPRIREVVSTLAVHGWFVHDQLPFAESAELADILKRGDSKTVDARLKKHFRMSLRTIKKSILTAYPERKTILNQAFTAHTRKQYYLSVPVFLAQADGICFELLGIPLFSKSKGKPRSARIVDQIDMPPLVTAFLEPLRMITPLSQDTDKIASSEKSYNRHAILHGLANDYGNEINSFKSISLVLFLTQFEPDHGDATT